MPQLAPIKHVEICHEPEYASNDPYPSMAPHALRKLLLPGAEAEYNNIFQPHDGAVISNSIPNTNYSSVNVNVLTGPVKRSILDESSSRAQSLRQKLIYDTNVLVVQGGTIDKLPIYNRLHTLGVNIYILDAPSSVWSSSKSHTSNKYPISPIKSFIPLPYSSEGDFATRAIDELKKYGYYDTIRFHAVITYYEDAVAYAAELAQVMNVPGSELEPCKRARSKYLTRKCMTEEGLPSPKFTSLLNEKDIDKAILKVGFPAVLKPSFGAASIGVCKVNNQQELRQSFLKLKHMIETDNDPLWLQGKEIVYEEYYDGDEFDIDVLMSNGECVYAKVSDNWGISEPYFQETGMHAPSSYPIEKQKELIQLSIQGVQALGFENGCLHVECRYTSYGKPRIIEINARMGGDPVYDFNKLVWGVDLVEEHYMAILGIPINPIINAKPKCYIAEFAFNAPYSGIIVQNDWLEFLRHDERIYRVKYFKTLGDSVIGPEDGVPDWIAEIIVVGKTSQNEVNEMVKQIVTQEAQVPIKKVTDHDQDIPSFFFPGHTYPF